MKNLIVQHWTGELTEIARLSMESIQEYADKIGVMYMFIDGNQFHESATWPPLQKLAMMNEEFDEFDYVVMTDMDMFLRKGATESIFDDPGYGVRSWHEKRIKGNLHRRKPQWFDLSCCYWGGSTTKWPRDMRIKFRGSITKEDIKFHNSRGTAGDEGMMFRLASKNQIKDDGTKHFKGLRWQYPNFHPGVEKDATLIHIRGKNMNKQKSDKMSNWRELRNKDLI